MLQEPEDYINEEHIDKSQYNTNRNNLPLSNSCFEIQDPCSTKCDDDYYCDSDFYKSSGRDSNDESEDDFQCFQILKEENPNPKNCDYIEFTIEFNEEEWISIKPEYVCHKDRTRYRKVLMLKKGWTDLIVDKMNESSISALPCAFSFKKQYVFDSNSNSGTYFKFHGKCKECKTHLNGECIEDCRADSSVKKVEIKTYDTKNIPHKEKRFCAGIKRQCLKNILKYELASNYRIEAAEKCIKKYGDFEPPNLDNTVKLRKIRQEAIYEDLNLHNGPKDLWESLRWIQKNSNSVRQINRYPFYIMYHSDEQLLLWKELAQKDWFAVSIDSSGSFIQKICDEGKNSGHVFLHAMVTKSRTKNSKIVPLCQMVSIRQDTNIIKFWLAEAAKQATVPNEVVTDDSLALLNAVCLAFNKCPFKEYLKTGFNYLKDRSIKLKDCYVRIDRAHLINTVARWNCFKKKNRAVKEFYLRCIGYCIEIESMELLEEFLSSIFIISQSKSCEQNSVCFQKTESLLETFETFHDNNELINEVLSKKVSVFYKEEPNADLLSNNIVSNYIERVFEEASNDFSLEDEIDSTPNFMTCPEIKSNIIYLFSQFVAWTNVLRNHYKSPEKVASSSRSETNFKNIRLQVPRPLKANAFLVKDLRRTSSQVKSVKAALDRENNSSENIKNKMPNVDKNQKIKNRKNLKKKNDSKKNLNFAQNGNKPILKNNFSKNISCKTKESEINVSPTTTNSIPQRKILYNASLLSNPGYVNNAAFYCTNTCSFDSLFETLVTVYERNSYFKDHVIKFSDSNATYNLIYNYVESGYDEINYYQKRTEILFAAKSSTKKGTQIICDSSASETFDAVFDNLLFLKRPNCKNRKCQFAKENSYNFLDFYFEELQNLIKQDFVGCINFVLNKLQLKCNLCDSSNNSIPEIGILLPISIENISVEEHYEAANLPETVLVQNNIYKLCGFVGYLGETFKLGHYTSFSKVSEGWLVRDDLKPKPYLLNTIPESTIISLVFYVQQRDANSSKQNVNMHNNCFSNDTKVNECGKINQSPIKTQEQSKHNLIVNGNNFKIDYNLFYELDKKLYRPVNTCPFDSLYEVLISAYKKSKAFRELTLEASNSKKMNILKSLYFYMENIPRQDLKKLYQNRFEIMYSIGEICVPQINSSYLILDCNYSATKLSEILLCNSDEKYSFRICANCGEKNITTLIVAQMKDIHRNKNGIFNLQNAIDNSVINKRLQCNTCKDTQLQLFFFNIIRHFCLFWALIIHDKNEII